MTDAVVDTSSGAVTSAPATAAPVAPASTQGPPMSAEAYMAQAMVANGHWSEAQAAEALAKDATERGEAPPQQSEATPEAAPFDRYTAVADMKSTLQTVGFEPRDIQTAEMLVSKGLTQAPTFEQNCQRQADTQQLLETRYGKEGANNLVGWAKREVAHMATANPNIYDLLERSGVGNDMLVIQALAKRGQDRFNKAKFGRR